MKTLLFILILLSAFSVKAPPILYPSIPGIVFWEPSNEGTGTTIHDYSGFANNLISTNGAALTWTNGATGGHAGPSGGAVWLNGTSQDLYVASAAAPSLNFLTSKSPITIGGWVWLNNATEAYTSCIAKEGGSNGYTLLIKSNQKLAFYLEGTTGVDQDGSSGTVPLNVWTHVCCCFDGTNISSYINGSLSAVTSATTANLVNSTGVLVLGNSAAWPTRWFPGGLTKWFISTNALYSNDVIRIVYTTRP
jgi:hypothetical protein